MTEPVPTARDYAQASFRDLTSHYLDLLDTDVLRGSAVDRHP